MDEEWELRIFGVTAPKGEDGFAHEDADAILDSVVKHLRAEGHTLTRIEISHGALRGGARRKDLTQTESGAAGEKIELTAEDVQPVSASSLGESTS